MFEIDKKDMNTFIDTNVLLGFYHLTSDDLKELRKLLVLIDEKKVTVHMPRQVINEFRRNRDSKLADALFKLRAENLNNQFPQICKEYPEYEEMRKSIRVYKKNKGQLLKKIEVAVREERLKADEVISELFAKVDIIEPSEELFSKAKRRFDLGNPPGKKNSYGDAVNWESLLHTVPEGNDIYFIADDKDYISCLDSDDFSPFLIAEWLERKASKIHFYKRLSAFFKEHFPDIKLANEIEKGVLIRKLTDSGAFSTTRSALKKLNRFSDFTKDQVQSIVSAAVSNDQVHWIMTDIDIANYLKNIVDGRENDIDERDLFQFREYLKEDKEPEISMQLNVDPPF